jgi:hypothetical protein
MLSIQLWMFQVVCSPKLYRQDFFSSILFVLLLLYINLTPLQRQRNCYGFSESCRCVLALHVAVGETRTLQIEVDIPEEGSELCTMADFCRHDCINRKFRGHLNTIVHAGNVIRNGV